MGKNYPIMNLYERAFNVLSVKYVDEVIFGAPRVITAEMITTMNIKVVVSGFAETRTEVQA
jgi:ethanolamine-phosphate cytidylyltransferase